VALWVWVLVDLSIAIAGGVWLAILGARAARNARRLKRIAEPAIRAAEALQNEASRGK